MGTDAGRTSFLSRECLRLAVCVIACGLSSVTLAQGSGADSSAPAQLTLPPAPSHTGSGEAPEAEAAAADAIRQIASSLDAPAQPVSTQESDLPLTQTEPQTEPVPQSPSPSVPQSESQSETPTRTPAPTPSSQALTGQGTNQTAAPGTASDATPEPPISSPLEGLVELNDLARKGEYKQAVPVAKRVLQLAQEKFGDASLATANAYVVLGKIQNKADSHQDSAKNYLKGIELIRDADGYFSKRVIEPLVGLGDNYHAAGLYLEAITAYGDARNVTQRIYGLQSETQIPMLERTSSSFMELDKFADANKRQAEILHLIERNHPPASPEYLAAIYQYADWLRGVHQFQAERDQYLSAIQVIRDQHGDNSPLLIEPLLKEAASLRIQRIPDTRGYSALRSALKIASAQSPPAPLLQAKVLRDMGDWGVAFSNGPADLEAYRQAWKLLGSVPDGVKLRKEWFGKLESVRQAPINRDSLSDNPDAKSGYVVIQFDVDKNGWTQNVQVVESNPVGLKDEDVAEAVRRWRYRPFMEGGKAVQKGPFALRFNYRYQPDEKGDDDKA